MNGIHSETANGSEQPLSSYGQHVQQVATSLALETLTQPAATAFTSLQESTSQQQHVKSSIVQNINHIFADDAWIPEGVTFNDLLNISTTIQQLKKIKAAAPGRETIVLIKETLAEECQKIRAVQPEIDRLLNEHSRTRQIAGAARSALHTTSVFHLKLQLLALAKQWGRLVGHANNGAELAKIRTRTVDALCAFVSPSALGSEQKDLIFRCVSTINDECKRLFCPKVKHPGCQTSMQAQFVNHFQPVLGPPTTPLFTLVHSLVFQSTQEYFVLANELGQNITFSEYENNLLVILMNYFLAYNLATHVTPTFPAFTFCGCSEFTPYCKETNAGSGGWYFTASSLVQLLDRYEEREGMQLNELINSQKEVHNIEDKITQVTETSAGRKAVAIVQLQLDMEVMLEKLSQNEPLEIGILFLFLNKYCELRVYFNKI